ETRLPGLEEVRLPPADRLLADLLAPGRLGDRHLAGEDAQHDPRLLLHRDHRWPSHVELSAQDSINGPATKSDARHEFSRELIRDRLARWEGDAGLARLDACRCDLFGVIGKRRGEEVQPDLLAERRVARDDLAIDLEPRHVVRDDL